MRFGALLGSELARLRARRAVRIAVLVAVGLTLVVLVVTAVRSTGTGPTDHTMRLRTLWLETGGRTSETAVLSVGVYLFLIAAALAATAIGGDYRAGTVATPLTWEPRRVRLIGARLLAIVLVTAGVYVLVTGIFVGGWWLGAAVRGSTTVPSHFWPDLLRVAARCLVTTAGFALVTAGLVLLTRSTVGGFIVWVAYLIGIEGVLANNVTGLRAHLLIANLGAFLSGHPEHFVDGGATGHDVVVGPSDGIVLLVAVVVAVVALGVVAFARRDVT